MSKTFVQNIYLQLNMKTGKECNGGIQNIKFQSANSIQELKCMSRENLQNKFHPDITLL